MPLMNADGPALGTIDGLPFESESISITTSGGAAEKKTFSGSFFSPTTPTTAVSIKSPVFGNATPLQVSAVKTKLTNIPALLIVTMKVTGATFTMWVVFDGRAVSMDATSGADETWTLKATEPIMA
jgi:hypothetical protein